MNMKHYHHIHQVAATLLLALVCLVLAGCKDDDDDSPAGKTDVKVRVVNVDVILPKNIQQQWQNSIDWALENIQQAQANLPQQVKLNLRYHDEDTEDLEKLAYRLTMPEAGEDTCHAIIGPYHSTHAQTLLNYAAQNRLPVVMPTCTSGDLQRIHARNTYAWFLTESDITQSEVMLSFAKSSNMKNVALIYSNDTYGRTFVDWFGYYATEFQLNIPGEGQLAYTSGANIGNFLQNITENAVTGTGEDGANTLLLCVALSATDDYKDVKQQTEDFIKKCTEEALAAGLDYGSMLHILPLFADTSCDETFVSQADESDLWLGITPYGSLGYGFPQAYYATYGRRPYNGEAQVYDALSIIALGSFYQAISPDQCLLNGEKVTYSKKPYEAGLTDYMRAVVSNQGVSIGWDEHNLSKAFSSINQENDFSLYGATGGLDFDSQTYTKVLNTTYMVWSPARNKDGRMDIDPLIYLSTAGTSSQASTTSIWEQEKRWIEENFGSTTEPDLPALTDNWAVVISPSTTWANYRHQADAFAMYQLLKDSGYDDDHIVLIVEDNLANDERNNYPGKIYVNAIESDDDLDFDVREGATVDYHFTQITRDDVADIMLGRQSDRLPQVIHPTMTSNVFFFWSGHGGQREGPLWGNEDATEYFGTQRIHDIVEQMNREGMYRRMMFAIETCYSGNWGVALQGQPNVLCITAANTREMSDADVHDKTLGVFLSNAFARTLRDKVSINNTITIYDLYKELARTTIGSHVTLYNQDHYGSVYTNTMQEYFPN